MWFEAKSKWCADFFRKVREAHRGMSRTNWFRWKVIGFMKGGPQKYQLTEAESKTFERKLAKVLGSFQGLFKHLRFPVGSRLEMHGDGCYYGGRVCLILRLSDGGTMRVRDIRVNPWSVEEIWEKEVLRWISSQFYLHWHTGTVHETILLGDASTFEEEMHEWTDEMATIDEFKAELSPKDLVRFEKTVFAPRVRWFGLFPCVVYHAFAPFRGIYRRVAGWPSWLYRLGSRNPVVTYTTRICY